MVARRMADERLLAVITSNSSHSVQKSCCVIATSSSTIRTFGFVIVFFPVIHQNGSGDVFSHLRPSPFRRMPGLKSSLARPYCKAGATSRARPEKRISLAKTRRCPLKKDLHVHTSRHSGGRVCEQQ